MTELYTFSHGSTHYRFTSADRDIIHDEQTYTAVPIGRSERGRDTSEDNKNLVQITLPHDNAVAALYLKRPPDLPVRLSLHRATSDGYGLVLTATVTGVKWTGYEATIECQSPMLQAARNGLRARYSSQCRHALYSRGCGVASGDYEATFTFVQLELDDTRIQTTAIDEPDADYYVAGVLTIGSERRVIIGHEHAVVDSVHTVWFDIDRPFVAAIADEADVEALPGCDHDVATCRDKFLNLPNFGGFPTIPVVNPFSRRITSPGG